MIRLVIRIIVLCAQKISKNVINIYHIKTCKGYVHKKCTELKQKQLKSMDRNPGS